MKRISHLYILLVLILLGINISSYAFQNENPEIVPSLINNLGLSNQNWAISQDPVSKYICFANSEGLVIYNGISWQIHSLPENMPIRSVYAHSNGWIFTGSFEEFGYWMYDQNGKIFYTSLSEEINIESNDEIWKIYEKNGIIYFQSFTSIYFYDFEKSEKITAPFTMLFLHKIEEQFVTQILEIGLFTFENNEFQMIPGSEIFADKKVHAIIPYKDQQWMICTDNDGIYIYDQIKFRYFSSEATDFLRSYTCNAALKLSENEFAFGSILNGLIITDIDGNIQRTYNTVSGLKNNTVLSLFRDIDSSLWVGMDEGVNYIDLLSPFTRYKTLNGAPGTIYAMLTYQDHLYIGTNHGLFRAFISKKGHVYNFNDLEFIPGSHGQVWTLDLIEDQIICGHNEGTFLVNNGSLKKISDITGGWSYIFHNDLVLGGTYTGIIVMDKGPDEEWQFRNKLENFTEPTRYLEVDYLGYLWASHHQKGIYKIELSDDLAAAAHVEFIPDIDGRSYNIKVIKINNRVVFVTPDGIYTYDFVRNEIIPFDALTSNLGDFSNASHISHHIKNKYWFIKEDKLALFDIGLDFSANKEYEIHQMNINLPQRRIQPVKIDPDFILIPNPQNFDAYNLSLYNEREQFSRLNFQKIIFYNQRDTLFFFDKAPKDKIKWNVNNLTVHFSDPSIFENPGKIYEYRIPELEQSWQITNTGTFTYLDLKHGSYTLEIRDDNQNIIQTTFSIARPWYLSFTAWIIYLFALLLIVWGLVEFFRFEIRRQKELVAMQLKKNVLEKELDYKSYELMLTMRHLLLKDNMLKDLEKQINFIREQSSKYPVKFIKNMEKIIHQGLGAQSAELENAINNLKLSQQGFFKALKEKYPELTPNDLRLCSYLRMNFTTKEIAQLLNISTRGVEISRHRLRKKLNLNQEENLFEFLMQEEFNFSE
jgi:ligand-binding sensor domain-containing protein/DNA-binding CsgD family transcriptional regulator